MSEKSKMPRGVSARAYCSSANLGAGFDVFGLALDKYSDTVTVERGQPGLRLTVHGFGELPQSVSQNSAGPPASRLFRKAGMRRFGLDVTVRKGVPPGLGLGSSGATAAAATRAVHDFLGLGLDDNELVAIASLGEKAVSGHPHADNVAASLLGGFTFVYQRSPVSAIRVKPPRNLVAVVATPRIQLPVRKTMAARKVVPKKVPVSDSVLNTGRASAIVAGFLKGDIELIGDGMEDVIAEPYREHMIPGFQLVKRAAKSAGASGVAISGAGPSIIAIVDGSRNSPERIGGKMQAAFSRKNVDSSHFVARPAGRARTIGLRQ